MEKPEKRVSAYCIELCGENVWSARMVACRVQWRQGGVRLLRVDKSLGMAENLPTILGVSLWTATDCSVLLQALRRYSTSESYF